MTAHRFDEHLALHCIFSFMLGIWWTSWSSSRCFTENVDWFFLHVFFCLLNGFLLVLYPCHPLPSFVTVCPFQEPPIITVTFSSRSALFVSGIKHTRRADYSSRRNAIPHTELFLHELFPFLIVNFLFPPLVRFLELSSTIISRPFYNSIPIKRHRFSKFLNSQYNALLSILVTGHHFDDLLRHPWLRVSFRSASW